MLLEIAANHDFIDNVFIDTRETEKDRRKDYGRCRECNVIKTDNDWCRRCNAAHFRKEFWTWTSGNKEIDYFIRNTQIHAWQVELALEWYPWDTFSEIEQIGNGGYATVFCAKTKLQRIKKWHHYLLDWHRATEQDESYSEYVALKTMSSESQLLNEVI